MNARIFVRRGRKARFRRGHRRENRVVLVRPLRRDPFGNLGREGGHALVRGPRTGNVRDAPFGPDGLADVRRGLKDGGDIFVGGWSGRRKPRGLLVRREFPIGRNVRQRRFGEPLVRRLREARVALDLQGGLDGNQGLDVFVRQSLKPPLRRHGRLGVRPPVPSQGRLVRALGLRNGTPLPGNLRPFGERQPHGEELRERGRDFVRLRFVLREPIGPVPLG